MSEAKENSTPRPEPLPNNVFAALLAWLQPVDAPAAAAERVFQSVRLRLIRFFEMQACPLPEDCADETIQRVAQKIGAGLVVEADDPYIYFRGVARLILQEQWRKHARWVPLEEMSEQAMLVITPDANAQNAAARHEQERRLRCLEKCLAAQPTEARKLFLAYHREQQRTKIDQRAVLAEQLGIDITALRNRITRMRRKLEECVRACANAPE